MGGGGFEGGAVALSPPSLLDLEKLLESFHISEIGGDLPVRSSRYPGRVKGEGDLHLSLSRIGNTVGIAGRHKEGTSRFELVTL